MQPRSKPHCINPTKCVTCLTKQNESLKKLLRALKNDAHRMRLLHGMFTRMGEYWYAAIPVQENGKELNLRHAIDAEINRKALRKQKDRKLLGLEGLPNSVAQHRVK